MPPVLEHRKKILSPLGRSKAETLGGKEIQGPGPEILSSVTCNSNVYTMRKALYKSL